MYTRVIYDLPWPCRAICTLVVAAYLLVTVVPTYAAGQSASARTVKRAFVAAESVRRVNTAARASENALRWAKIAKAPGALPDREIARLSRFSKLHGSSRVGQELQHLRLSSGLREDVYLRVAIHKRLLSRDEALEIHRGLSGVDGFPATIGKAISNNEAQRIGHLNELRIATAAARQGFKPLALGKKYNDGLKRAPTDVDILMSKDGTVFALEVKDYTGPISLSTYRADLDSLMQYKHLHNSKAVPVFTIVNKPDSATLLQTMQREAERRNVQLIFGSPTEQIHKLQVIAQLT